MANRILTTHVGSLPRPKDLVAMRFRSVTDEAMEFRRGPVDS